MHWYDNNIRDFYCMSVNKLDSCLSSRGMAPIEFSLLQKTNVSKFGSGTVESKVMIYEHKIQQEYNYKN